MQTFQQSEQEQNRVNLGIPSASAWQIVLDAVADAQFDADVNAVKGMGGLIRNLMRKLGEAGPAFEDWLKILPTDIYGSVICGGFTIIINAANRHRELCQEVFDALGRIPEIIDDAKFAFGEYDHSEELHTKIANLYMAIIETLRCILRFYEERAAGRHLRAARNAFKSITKGSNYGQEIRDSMKHVMDSASRVKLEVGRCFQRRVGVMKNVQDFQVLQVAKSHKIMQNLYEDLQDRIKSQQLSWEMKDADIHNTLRNELQEIKRAIIPNPTRKNGPSTRRISQLIGTSPDIPMQDVEEIQREAQTFPTSAQCQVSDLMGSQKLQDWLTSPYSSALFAQANAGDDKISAMSYVTSLLVQSVEGSEEAVPLCFYCGLHTDAYHDTLSSANGMVRSLVMQLLQKAQHDFDLEFVDRNLIHDLENADLGALCDLLVGTVQQLPQDITLFLVIDGISFYETHARVRDTCFAVDKIMEMVDNAKFVFKLLVTSPGASPVVSKAFHAGQTYWLPDVDSEDDGDSNYKVGAFKNQARQQARNSRMGVMGLMRTNSELNEDY